VNWKAKAYIGLVLAAGAAAAGRGLFLHDPWDATRFICYLVLAVLASGLKVSLPGVTGTMSVLSVFLLAAISELNLQEAMVIAVICILVQCFWHAKVRPRPVQILFSLANIAFAVAATDYIYRLPLTVVLQTPFRLAIAASTFFVTNSLPIAVIIAMTEGKSFREVWRNCYLWCFPYYLVGAGIVCAFSFTNRLFDWQAGVLIVPSVYVIYRTYRLYLKQLQTERDKTEKERAHAEEVAALHVDTVAALTLATNAKARLEAVIGGSPQGILTLDLQRNVTSWNKTAEKIFGWRCDEILGRSLPFSGTESAELTRDLVDRTFRGEPVGGTEVTQLRRDGTPFESEFRTAPLRDAENNIAEILISVADISDRKRLEEQLRVSQKMEAVGRLAGGIAHDFNNILTVINGYSTMLLESYKGDSDLTSQVQEILGAGNRAAELVSQLLAVSRRQLIKPRSIEINQLVQDVERMLRRIIGEYIELRTEFDPRAGWIHADRNQMEGVLLNLAANARDAMPEGGKLTIGTAQVDVVSGDSLERQLPAGSYVRVTVEDTGHGMDHNTQQHIFEPFFTTKAQGKGTGLGLSSVYATIEQNHGHILLASEIGNGTTFSMYLPRHERPATLDSPRLSSLEAPQGVETILLVEDERAVRRMLRGALSAAGYRVWEAGNGAEAIRQCGADLGSIDLLVTDIVMPVMNGLRLAEELRDRRPSLKVVFMSGHSEEVISGQIGSDPSPDILQKPLLPEVLVRKVREVLDAPSKSNRRPTPIRSNTRDRLALPPETSDLPRSRFGSV
jgi:PAS domain S-box-containing protein